MVGFMDEWELKPCDYYRDTAEEIRRLASRSQTAEVAADLLLIAAQFDRMAEFVEKSGSSTAGLAASPYPGHEP